MDRAYIGSIDAYYPSGFPECGGSGTLSKVISSENHSIEAEDDDGHIWKFTMAVAEGVCSLHGLRGPK